MTHESDSWWEIPWISYFVSLFKHPFNITEFSILEFEDSLNNDDQGKTNNDIARYYVELTRDPEPTVRLILRDNW